MKVLASVFLLIFCHVVSHSQMISSAVETATVYSQNEKYYLKTVPFDNESPTTRGATSVYQVGNPKPLYEFERGFDNIDDDSNYLIISDNGEVIIYFINYDADETREGLKSITIYKNGKIAKSYTESEITGCNKETERCDLVYYNDKEVVDEEKSNWGTKNYKKVFKDGVDGKEKFLSDFAIFSDGNTVYLTDSKKNTHLFDLKEGVLLKSVPFENIFPEIKNKGRVTKTLVTRYDAPVFLEYPKLKNGGDAEKTLAAFIGMKPYDIYSDKDKEYKRYSFKINTTLLQNGSLEIEDIDVGEDLPKEKIVEFFSSNKFVVTEIPKVFPKWNIGEKIFFLRKANDAVARKERELEIVEEREELKKNLVAEKIDDVYIPKDLGECFTELDRMLKDVDKKEMQSLPKRDEMIKYHLGLGMWMRNNWRLWGGSRLQKYFTDKGIAHPDDMSSVILFYYHDWLSGRKETWKDWEKNPKQIYGK